MIDIFLVDGATGGNVVVADYSPEVETVLNGAGDGPDDAETIDFRRVYGSHEHGRRVARLLLWLACLNEGAFSDGQLFAIRSGGALLLLATRGDRRTIAEASVPTTAIALPETHRALVGRPVVLRFHDRELLGDDLTIPDIHLLQEPA